MASRASIELTQRLELPLEVLEQRKHEATVATKHAAQAVQREQEAGASLEDTRARERDAREEVSTLQRSRTSSSSIAE